MREYDVSGVPLSTAPSDPHEISDAAAEAVLSIDDARRSHTWDVATGRSNVAALAAGHVLGILCSVVAAWIGTRILGPAGYGHLALIIAASLMLMVTTNWTASAVVRYGVREFVETGKIARVFWARAFTTGLILLLVLATAPSWIDPLMRGLRIPEFLGPWTLAYFSLTVAWYHMQHGLMAAKLPKVAAALLTFERVIVVILLFVLKVSSVASLRLVVGAYIAAAVACILVSGIMLRRVIFPLPPIRRSLIVEILVFSAPLLPSTLVAYFSSSYLDSFFIARFMSAAAVGIYAVAYQFTGAVMMLHARGSSLLQPFFMSIEPDQLAQKLRQFTTRVLPVIATAWAFVCVVSAAVGGPLLVFIFGQHYSDVARLLWPLMASAALTGPVVAGYFPIVLSVGRTSVIAVNSIASAVLNVLFDLLLIPRYGLVGCAWGTVAAYLVSLGIVIVLSDRVLRVNSIWCGIATLPAVAAAAAAYRFGALAGIAAALLLSIAISWLRRVEMREGVAILYRAFR